MYIIYSAADIEYITITLRLMYIIHSMTNIEYIIQHLMYSVDT